MLKGSCGRKDLINFVLHAYITTLQSDVYGVGKKQINGLYFSRICKLAGNRGLSNN